MLQKNNFYSIKVYFIYFQQTRLSVILYNMKTIHISIFFLILATTVFSQCCLRFEGKKCVLCPAGTHLFRGNCIIDVKDCLTYKDGFDCATCNSGFQLNSTGDCEKIVTPPPVSINMIQNIVLIDPKNLKGPAADLFAISDDYLRSSKSQLTDAIPTAGRVKTFPNKTNQITIQYSIKNIYYRAILQMETDPLIIKQVSISKVSNLIIKLATTTPNTAKSVIFNPIAIINISAINLNNLNHLDIISLVQMQLINQNQQIDSIKSGNITTIFDGTYNISLLYSSKNKVIDLLITATVLKDRTAKIVEVKKIPSNLVTTPPITPNINIVNSDTLSINYVDFDPKNSIDQNYLICKDLINIQTVDFKNLDPTSAKRYSQAQFIFYQLRFTKLDSSIWQISINYDSNNYIAKIDKITQITNPTKPTNPVSTFTIVNDAQIYKDMYFLIVLDYINKQSNNKYKDSKIVSVQKSVNGVLNIYRVNFQEAGFKWEVLANINVSSFVTTGFVESKGNQIRSDSVDSNLTQISSQSAINKVVISQPTQAQIQNPTNIPTATGTSKSIPTPEPNNIKTPSPTPTPTQISTPIPTSTTIPTTTLTLTPASASVPVPAPAPTSTPNPTLTPTPSPISTPTSTSTPTLTPTSTLTSIPTPNPTPNPAQTSKPIPTPVPNSSDQASSSSNFSPKSNPNETSPQSAEISINPTIMQLATGFTRLTKTDLSSNQFVQIDSLIKSSNTRQLRNSVVLAAFSKTTSFTRNYQIYYSRTGSPEIYQALISRDQLRRRTYIISFTKI